jgi:hypothetical protein
VKTLNNKLTLSQKDVVFSLQRGSVLYRVGEYTRNGYRFILSNDNVHKIVGARTVHALVNRGLLEWTASGRTLRLTEDGKTWSAVES